MFKLDKGLMRMIYNNNNLNKFNNYYNSNSNNSSCNNFLFKFKLPLLHPYSRLKKKIKVKMINNKMQLNYKGTRD
jgi:hypothetical protein